MTNAEWIRNLSDQQLSEYMYSVFVAGKMYGRGLIEKADLVDYRTWLWEEHKESDKSN